MVRRHQPRLQRHPGDRHGLLHPHLRGPPLPSPCVPVNSTARGVSCYSELYDYGVLASTEGCGRELGRGSAEVFGAGCRRFYDDAQCQGTPYLQLPEGQCYSEIVITGFTCSDSC